MSIFVITLDTSLLYITPPKSLRPWQLYLIETPTKAAIIKAITTKPKLPPQGPMYVTLTPQSSRETVRNTATRRCKSARN
jgi:hypothetical protein